MRARRRRRGPRPGLLGYPREPALGLLDVGEHQLRLHRVDVGARVDAALGVGDALVEVGADDVTDGVGLADPGQEPVAEPLALGGAAHEPRDVVELDRLRDDRARAHDLGHRAEPLVGDLDDRDVGVDGRERVHGGLRRGAGERVEQRRLAGVRKADDADFHGPPPAGAVTAPSRPSPGHACPSAAPSAAPASTSEG